MPFMNSIITSKFLRISLITLVSALALTLGSCGGNQSASSLEDELNKEMADSNINETSREMITDLIGSFPTPIEMALIVKQGEYPFNKKYLLTTDSLQRFSDNYSKAMAMGAFGANMGYINIYEKSLMAVEYLSAIRILSKDLDLEHLFDFETMLDLATSSDNIDSLIIMSTKSFNDMDEHLREKGRDELSVLMILGTWLEGNFITANLYLAKPEENVKDRISEQKDSFEKLIKIMTEAYPNDEYITSLLAKFQKMVSLYGEIEIEYIFREPLMTEVDGQLVIVDQSEMIITASDECVTGIAREMLRLRNELLN